MCGFPEADRLVWIAPENAPHVRQLGWQNPTLLPVDGVLIGTVGKVGRVLMDMFSVNLTNVPGTGSAMTSCVMVCQLTRWRTRPRRSAMN